jgi:hypothetical protein
MYGCIQQGGVEVLRGAILAQFKIGFDGQVSWNGHVFKTVNHCNKLIHMCGLKQHAQAAIAQPHNPHAIVMRNNAHVLAGEYIQDCIEHLHGI